MRYLSFSFENVFIRRGRGLESTGSNVWSEADGRLKSKCTLAGTHRWEMGWEGGGRGESELESWGEISKWKAGKVRRERTVICRRIDGTGEGRGTPLERACSRHDERCPSNSLEERLERDVGERGLGLE